VIKFRKMFNRQFARYIWNKGLIGLVIGKSLKQQCNAMNSVYFMEKFISSINDRPKQKVRMSREVIYEREL